MRISSMKAKDQGIPVRILVSPRMRHKCDDDQYRWGYFYCVENGDNGFFTLTRPHSGCNLQKFEDYDQYSSAVPITKEVFVNYCAEYLKEGRRHE